MDDILDILDEMADAICDLSIGNSEDRMSAQSKAYNIRHKLAKIRADLATVDAIKMEFQS